MHACILRKFLPHRGVDALFCRKGALLLELLSGTNLSISRVLES